MSGCGAMILAAGLGTRMRPLSLRTPKPLLVVRGQPLIDHLLDRLAEVSCPRVVVNVHWLAGRLVAHLAARRQPEVRIADETEGLLGSGGGVAAALPLLGDGPFPVVNGDSYWKDGGGESALAGLWRAFDPAAMDALLLVCPRERAHGHTGPGDFFPCARGHPDIFSLRRRGEARTAPLVFTGIQILHPRLFSGCPGGAFSLNLLYDRALARGRLCALGYGGEWWEVGTPAALAAVNAGFPGGQPSRESGERGRAPGPGPGADPGE